MKTDNIRTWIEDLRSGNFKQTIGILQTFDPEEAFCCLGVYAYAFLNGSIEDEEDQSYPQLSNALDDFIDTDLLILWNDVGEYSFDQIATYVEQALDAYEMGRDGETT